MTKNIVPDFHPPVDILEFSLGACRHRFDFSTLYEPSNLPPPKGFVILSSKRQSARIAKCVASHSCVRKMPLLANFLALLGQVTDILRSAMEGRTRNSEFFNLKKKPGNKQFSIEITKRKDDGEKWPNIARAIVLKSELSQKRAVIGMRASNFCLPARHERRPTYFQSRTSNFRRSLLGECPMDTAKNREKRFHESVTNPCCSPSSPAEDTTATAVVNSTRIVNLTAITNNSCFQDIRTGAMSRFSR